MADRPNVSHPWQAFLHELRPLNIPVIIVPGGSENDALWGVHGPDGKRIPLIIILNLTDDDITRGIVGLHELGHYYRPMNIPRRVLFDALALGNKIDPRLIEAMRAEERAAWHWAASKMPPGFESEFATVRDEALKTYETPEQVKGMLETLVRKSAPGLHDRLFAKDVVIG